MKIEAIVSSRFKVIHWKCTPAELSADGFRLNSGASASSNPSTARNLGEPACLMVHAGRRARGAHFTHAMKKEGHLAEDRNFAEHTRELQERVAFELLKSLFRPGEGFH